MEDKTIIVIVTYNGLQWLPTCLNSIMNFECIVVDNKSSDKTVEYIKSKFPNVHLIQNDENLGFGKANNIGIRVALEMHANRVFLLNQDAYLLSDSLEKLVAFQKYNPEFGIVSPIHLNSDGNKLDKPFGNYMMQNLSMISDALLINKLSKFYEIPFVNAAAWLISEDCLKKLGGFDPIFSHYGEDDNYCQRLRYHGLKIGVLTDSYIIHDRSDRKTPQIKPFSNKALKNIEKNLKVDLADINKPYGNKLKNYKKSILKEFLFSVLLFKRRNANYYFKLLNIIKRTQKEVMKSRKINKTEGLNYLEKT